MDAEAWRQAKGVLAEALSTPPNERDALIAARCPDPDMRREVQAYLNEYDEHFLESVITVSDMMETASPDATGEQLPDINSGDQIGPYVVLSRLGVGGMGHVFLGNDTRLHRKVALKCLSATASAGELRARILHEARAAARITHPNIAIVHDVVEHENRPFLVMEYVEGENLAALIKRERQPTETIVTFMRQLASALAAAHAKGIVHRDLKPANIQVTPAGSVKILDFGVAHAMSAASMGSTTSSAGLTVSMTADTLQGDRRVMHPGTPAYMSPEQMFGRPIDQRSDIYSLGIIVYEMATGHRPYATDDPLDLVVTLSRNFLRPGDNASRLPTQISGIVSRMLAVKPEDRYQTAGELENALVELTAPGPVVAAVPAWRSRVRAAGRVAAAAGMTIAAAAVLGFIETYAFNATLGRVPPFDREPRLVWLEMGLRGLVTPLLYTVALFIAIAAVKFVLRLLRLSRGIEHMLTTGASRTARLGERLGLADPLVLGQTVAGVGVLALVAAIWGFLPFMTAFATKSISDFPAAHYALLQPSPFTSYTAHLYRLVFALLTVGFGLAAARIQRLRAMQSIRGGAGLAMVLLLCAVSIVMCQLPYRIVWKNEMPRLDVAGERCYALGATAGEVLIHCPDRQPPRNRIVKRSDPTVRDTGIRQNIFTPPETSHE